jgi:hypothetical protein
LARQYDAQLNGGIEASDLSIEKNLKRLITWACPKGPDHNWRARLIDRVKRMDGCPFCKGRKASSTNSLASAYPSIASELHPSENGSINADAISSNSTKKVNWLGKCGHTWQTQVRLRTQRGYGCPKCKRRKNA